jgi:CDP-6-deoxy-D-xylo-4-hexulose-3-dehydrase
MNYKLASSTWDDKEIQAMQEVIASGNFTMGEKVKEYERSFADYFGSKYAVMSNSGSSANLLAVAAMRYRKDFDSTKTEIIVPAVSWSTTYYPIHQLGFRLKFVDINLGTLNTTPDLIEAAIDENTAGIFAVNLLGNPSELNQLRTLADQAGIFLLEDNCESMGAKLGGKFTGTFGDIGTFSTFFSHHISTMEGGMCLTEDEELSQIMTSMRAHGWTRELPRENSIHNKSGDPFEDSFRFVLPGYNLRPLEMSGAIGLSQLNKLAQFVQTRKENADKFLRSTEHLGDLLFQEETAESSWFGFSIILTGANTGRRLELSQELRENGIEHRPIVAGNFTQNPVIRHLNHAPISHLPNAEKLHVDGLFVGNHHFPLDDEIEKLVAVLEMFSANNRP